jgi:2-oxoglutarate ferredoxin oxidoreductase subunit alpha
VNIRHNDPKEARKWYEANYRPEQWKEHHGNINDYRGKAVNVDWRLCPTPKELEEQKYERFQLTANGVSPMTVPGMAGGEHTNVGIEHTQTGMPSSSHIDHQVQSEKRFRKFEEIASKYVLINSTECQDQPELGILTWGSTFGVCQEISELLNQAGLPTQVIAPTILYPLPYAEIQKWLDGLGQLITVETSFGDQFYHYIKAFLGMPERSFHYSRAGGIPMRLAEVMNFILYNIELPEGFNMDMIRQHLDA